MRKINRLNTVLFFLFFQKRPEQSTDATQRCHTICAHMKKKNTTNFTFLQFLITETVYSKQTLSLVWLEIHQYTAKLFKYNYIGCGVATILNVLLFLLQRSGRSFVCLSVCVCPSGPVIPKLQHISTFLHKVGLLNISVVLKDDLDPDSNSTIWIPNAVLLLITLELLHVLRQIQPGQGIHYTNNNQVNTWMFLYNMVDLFCILGMI